MQNKKTKLLDAEQIQFEDIGDEFLSITFSGEKFVMDLDTLIDLSFRCASFLTYLESKQENSLTASTFDCGCQFTKISIH